MFRRLKILTATAIPVLLLWGCGAIKMYAGPDRPPDQIAVLEVDDVILYTIDNIPVKRASRLRLEILPGEYTLKASHNFAGYPEQIITYDFTAEAGHRYLFSADYTVERTLSWRPWVKDVKTEQILGGWK